jgi:tRNA(Ile)-lysidine synthase
VSIDKQLATVASTIDRHRMLSPGELVLVAFSGGADSTALAILLGDLGYRIILGHVDHGMRKDSGADARHCAKIAGLLESPFLLTDVRVDPPSQAEARRMRYAALNHMSDESGATRIATGHSLDDQAETVKMRLERGGYGMGIPPVRDNIIRPLLGLRRAELEQVCDEAGVPYVNDPSNLDPKYTRVRIRFGLEGATDEFVRELAAEAEVTAHEAAAVLRETATACSLWVRFEAGAALIDRRALGTLQPPVARQLLRRLADSFGVELTYRLIRDILTKVVPVTGARLSLGDGLSVWSERENVSMGQWAEAAPLPELPLAVPGVTNLPEWELEVVAEPASVQSPFASSRFEELVDADVLGAQVSIRQWRPGDRFEPLGTAGRKKLHDFFVDSGIPRRLRSSVPLLVAGDRIAWVVGHRIDERFKLTERSKRAMRLRASFVPEVKRQSSDPVPGGSGVILGGSRGVSPRL